MLIFFGDFLEIHDAQRAFGSLTTCRRLSQMSLQAEQPSDVLLGQWVRTGVAGSNREGSGRVGCLARMHVVRLLAKRLDNILLEGPVRRAFVCAGKAVTPRRLDDHATRL